MGLTRLEEKDLVLGNLVTALALLQNSRDFSLLMPEVRVNLVYALPQAKTVKDVAGIDGRITVVNCFPRAVGLPTWGGSDHMARLILEARHFDPAIRAGINFKSEPAIIRVVKEFCQEKGFPFGLIDRREEPRSAARRERGSMPWKIRYLVRTYGGVPKLFYENEGWGKEPLFVALGKDAVEVAKIALAIAQRYRSAKRAG